MMEPTEQTRQKKGYQKIARFCERLRADGFEYVWVDTCCINKESSAELTESINSMFRWYHESARCYAYISDVANRDRDQLELVAPREMVFLDNTWLLIGSREDLCHEIEKVTKVGTSLLLGKSRLDQFSVAKRMSWASTRETTRAEDRAYCLMGIFNVNMPLLYGEGDNAFIRLQEEIMKNSNDETLFAWESNGVSKKKPCGLLARSPKDFANSGDIFPISVSKDAMPFTATNRGVRIQSPLLPPRAQISTLILQCSTGDGVIGIGVMSKPGTANSDEDFVRRKGSLKREIPFDLLFGAVLDTVYIPKSFVGAPTNDDVTDPLDSNDDANSESDFETPGGVLRSRIQPRGHHKKLIISFDDTQARFTGDESDSNVAKIHRMFERSEDDQVCFYRAWTPKTTLEEIVMDGYRFLMEHYQRDDIISLFGYSKGGYAAQFLSNLIDYMGILVPGHDYMVSEVWRIFYYWVLSTGTTEEQREAKKRKFTFMKSFRESFVRPANEKLFFGVFDAIDLSLGKNQWSMNRTSFVQVATSWNWT
ncbi:hypothetical protein N7467_007164 [Penicillium canescens]|nr:hypothetical protein N7467_007164 [Penicillium canescens]